MTTGFRLLDTHCAKLLRHLRSRDRILFLTTSTRDPKQHADVPKSTQLARFFARQLRAEGKTVHVLDVGALTIYPCEGHISGRGGNNCGVIEAALPDAKRNPTGHHRCWASVNNPDDELHRVSRLLFESDCVVFFVSVRWGQTNGIYQRLLERLSWIENRVTTLGEGPIPQLKNLEAGMVLFGQNWRGKEILATQLKNFRWFGFKTPRALSFNWQATADPSDERPESYLRTAEYFHLIVRGLGGDHS